MKRFYTRSSIESPVISTPAPARPPAPSAAPTPRPPHRSLLWLIVVAAAVVAAIVFYAVFQGRARLSGGGALAETVRVVRGNFVNSIRLTGTMEAVESYNVTAPRIRGASGSTLMLTELDTPGTKVKKGDVVAEFDPEVEVQNYLTAHAAYQGLVDQIAAKKADAAAARATDDTSMTQAEDAVKKAQLEILKDPILSPNDVKTNQLNLEEAAANLKQFKTTYALKRQSAQADIQDFEMQAEMKRLDMLQAQQNEKLMVVRAPADGIVVINTTWKGNGFGPFQVGDTPRPAQAFMRIVDPAHMRANIDLNQLDYPFIHPGEPVIIHMDAYPGVPFRGAIQTVSPIANASDFSDDVRTLSAVASVEGSDPRLMPDLSAAVDVTLNAQAGALIIPRAAVISEKGKSFVMVKDGSEFRRQEVKLGPVSDTQAVVDQGLSAGDAVKRSAGTSYGPVLEGAGL